MRRNPDSGAAPPPRRRNPARRFAPELARAAEEAAALYLRVRGFRLEGQNVRIGRDEVDLVVLDRSSFIIVEVRARSDPRFRPEDSLDPRKRRRLLRAGRRLWERWHGLDPEVPPGSLGGIRARTASRMDEPTRDPDHDGVAPRALRFDLIAVSWSRDGFSLLHYPRFLRPGAPERF